MKSRKFKDLGPNLNEAKMLGLEYYEQRPEISFLENEIEKREKMFTQFDIELKKQT